MNSNIERLMYANSQKALNAEEPKEWSAPKPLPEWEVKIDPLPPSLLPEALRPWIEDSGLRMGVPLEMLAIPALVGLSAVTGRRAAIQPKKHDSRWIVVPNLWGAIVAPPGSLKSPSMSEALRPLSDLEKAQTETYRKESAEAQVNELALESEIQAYKDRLKQSFKSDAPEGVSNREDLKQHLVELESRKEEARLSVPRLSVHDVTVEKLVEIHRDNPLGILLKRDELMGFLTKMDQEGHESDRAFFLEAWSGNQPFVSDRIGRGTVRVEATCLAIFGTIQPQPLNNYFAPVIEGKGDGDGLLQRFSMLVYPEFKRTKWKNNDRTPDEMAYRRAFDIYNKIFESREVGLGGDLIPTVLHFSEEAQSIFDHWREEFENRLLNDIDIMESPAFQGHLGKYRKLMPSLALLFHLAERASGKTSENQVSASASLSAIHWCQYLENHARKVYAGTLRPDLLAAQELSKRIKDRSIQSGMAVREIYRKEWRGLSTQKLVRSAIRILEDLNWVRTEYEGVSSGPSREIIRLNPTLISSTPN